MTLNLPTQPFTFLKAVEFFGEYEDAIPLISDMKNDMKEFIQFVEESSCDSFEGITTSLQKITDDLYSNLGRNVNAFKALYYENNQQMEIIHRLASNYVHGLFHVKFWIILTKTCFAIQDALLYSTCQASTIQNDCIEYLTMASDVFYSIEHDLLTPEEVSNALIGFINKINNGVPIIANRIETIKKIIVLLKPIHLMSIYHYVALTNNNDVTNVLKQIIDDLLMNGPVIQFVQENMVCLMDEE
ncbi:hypothetical protein ENUP19_0317G0079 [Entamoeba nuttalli]|uniref:Uncharacterized protein n=2 Tax=Entamoeba nuttalli TaxID=412467 RepID=K2G5T7_ENTNP|nr:hypothetical protein ENU1_188620 [Entamoeba nuttalli P19]EKE37711.1 hypothetical protein ENU1_188620 [Entamoeba nuttalli P19]|eukprot:XP_008859957.1 hypothetical protein ENU1_188620 [Entamoeba nuttalli P19]